MDKYFGTKSGAFAFFKEWTANGYIVSMPFKSKMGQLGRMWCVHVY